ncbi:MAG: carboxypeptidase regulatory-like domain-containing protein [Acidobacteria bacterium]|nr:carboxypeptidase regulatory-like domain-containing protein [Acidobacteriota bacterium]
MFRRLSTQLCALLALAIVCVAPALAQTNLGGIAGTITDHNGAVVPGATVTITNLGTNRIITVRTSKDGVFTAELLEPVLYRVSVEVPGFKRSILENVKVDTATTATLNIALETGALSDTVTIRAESPIINAESGTTGQTITQQQIIDLPLNNRNVLELATIVPNVVAPEGTIGTEDPVVTTQLPAPGGLITVNGGRQGTSAILADGVNNSGISYARAAVTFSPDMVKELTVQTSAYSAEYGQTGGGVINATTKSGTNSLSGTLYWYNRNPIFAANPFSIAAVNRPFANRRQNQFGVLVGGPVYLPRFGEGGKTWYDGHNRTFFFVAFEPRWYSDGFNIDALMPTDAMRRGDLSNTVNVSGGIAPAAIADQLARSGQLNANQVGIPVTIFQQFLPVASTNQLGQRLNDLAVGQAKFAQFPNNIIPASLLDPTAQRLLQYLPPAGDYFINVNGQLRNYNSTRFVKNREKRLTLRFDHQISKSNQANFRYTQVPIFGSRGRGEFTENAILGDYSASKQILFGDTHIFSTRVVNDLKLNYTRGLYSRTNPPEYQTRNFSTELGLPSLTTAGLPVFRLGVFNIGQESVGALRDDIEENFNIANTLSVTRGNMNIKIGADLRHQRYYTSNISTASGGDYSFGADLTNSSRTNGAPGGAVLATYLLGVPSAVGLRNAIVPYYYRWNSAAVFIQDDWKARPNLTLNLGLRYQLQLPRTEKYDRQATFLLDEAKSVTLTADQRIIRRANGQPLTITGANGQTVGVPSDLIPAAITSPAYAFAGAGGRSRYLTPFSKTDFEPRIGFAYAPRLFGLFGLNKPGARPLLLRGGYGISHDVLTAIGRGPYPDFALSGEDTFNFERGAVNPAYAMRLSSNPPLLKGRGIDQVLIIPPGGVVSYDPANLRLNSLNYRDQNIGFAVDPNSKTPYLQSWNLNLQYEMAPGMALEFGYVGSKGTHFFGPRINLSPPSFTAVEQLIGLGFNPDEAILDPLGRQSPNGSNLTFPLSSLTSKFAGFNPLVIILQPTVNSIRHGGFVSIQRRFSRGLAYTANYTFSKTIDQASDSSPVSPGGITASRAQVGIGGDLRAERSVAQYDISHSIVGTMTYELPFGRGRALFSDAPKPVNAIIGGFQLTSIVRMLSGYPLVVIFGDTNRLGNGGPSGRVRPDLVQGVPLKNPLWRRDCPVGQACEPYFNPAAFMRPPKGELGNAARTFGNARTPFRHFFDLGIQKNIYLGSERRRHFQIRAEAINVLNHPAFDSGPNESPTLFNALPSEVQISNAEYDQWARINNRPLTATTEGRTLLGQINSQITGAYLPGTAILPANFFAVRLPQGFATAGLNSFDLTTPAGLKLYRLKQQYNQSFGSVRVVGQNARQVQFMLKFYF